MWKRKTYHECADELSQTSDRFRLAYTNTLPPHMAGMKQNILEESSRNGVEVLRALALSIRSEQDYGILPRNRQIVGIQKNPATDGAIYTCKEYFSGQYERYTREKNYGPLYLRDALNKIAHANPGESAFFADQTNHDLILVGTNRNDRWIAVINLLQLIEVLRELPDFAIRQN